MSWLPIIIPSVIGLLIFLWIVRLRRIVPTNVVHIVQRGSQTVSYGVGKASNVYYEWPKWLPVIGIEVRELPVSNFDIDLYAYSAYDKDRVPFVVDVKAFFHIADTNIAAAKVSSYEELKQQLENVVQGAVRSILAKSKLEEIMEERSVFGEQFTTMVNSDLKNWGVESIKNIELMDVRDSEDSRVIHQIMAKRMSAIDMESRTEVALNKRKAEEAELEAEKSISVKRADTVRESGEAEARSNQAIGIANAEATKKAGIAEQESLRDIAEARQKTAEKDMEVIKVTQVKQAEINKEQEIIDAEKEKKKMEVKADAEKYRIETEAKASLEAKRKEAEGVQQFGIAEAAVIAAKGESEASAEKSKQLASVIAQTTLAKDIGENKGYQDYLIKQKEVEVSQVIGVAQYEAMATALASADLKLLVNSGDVQSGMSKFSDLLSSKGASQVNGLIESLKQTDEGKAILGMVDKIKKIIPDVEDNLPSSEKSE